MSDPTASKRISAEYLQIYLDQLDELRKRNPGEWMHQEPWRLALEELRDLRAEVERIRALLDKACEIGLHLASVSRRDESVRYERLTTIRREAKGEG